MSRSPNACWFSALFFITYSSYLLALVTENGFNEVNNTLLTIYRPIVALHLHSSLELISLYEDYGGSFKVDSMRKVDFENRFILTLTGEIPKHVSMTEDGYALVACHEFGHALGGEPKQQRRLDAWSSVEGQADFYATHDCMWKYIENMAIKLPMDIPHESLRRCQRKYEQNKLLGCVRIFSAIEALADYLNARPTHGQKIGIHKHDENEVNKTLSRYPSDQCRLDTWLAGLFDEPRPRCWYKNEKIG